MGFIFKQESDLIITLKKQHVIILRYLDNFNPFLQGKSFSVTNCIVSLREIKNILVTHLMLEDDKLYPALESSKVKKIRDIGRKFSSEMQLISEQTFDFFNKYNQIKTLDLGGGAFKKNLYDLKEKIINRVNLEEKMLYPLYEQNPLMTEKEKKYFRIKER